MDGPQTRQRPAGTGREVAEQIELARQLYGTSECAARAGYHGQRPPHLAHVPRDEGSIAQELVDAAARLRAIAFGITVAGSSSDAVAEAGRLVTGCDRLIGELRARGTA